MSIAWNLLNPVDTGSQVMQGFNTGMALTKGIQTRSALSAYMANPDDPAAYGALAYLDPQTAQSLQQRRAAQRKEQQERDAQGRAVALGELYNQDPQGAIEEAVGAGDFDLAKTFRELSEADQKRSADFWGQAGSVAFTLKQERDPAKRQALWAEAKQVLGSQGAPAQLLEQFDPLNDTQIDAAIATSQKIGDLITQSRVTWHQQGEQPSFATDYMGRPVGSQNPHAGSPGGSAAPGEGPATVGATLSSAGLPAHVVAGFLGNFDAEGGYGGARGDGGTVAGIAQWDASRQANFQRVIGKPVGEASHAEQAQFVLWEMQNPEAAGMTVEQRDSILNAKSPEEAASLIDQFYERSSGEHRSKRVEAAKRYASGGVQSKSVGGKTYYKVNGQWFDNPEGV